eukprot:10100200-Alexandrium_andersonii.AAC.1
MGGRSGPGTSRHVHQVLLTRTTWHADTRLRGGREMQRTQALEGAREVRARSGAGATQAWR